MAVKETMAASEAPHGVHGVSTAFNDWPNDAGVTSNQDQTDMIKLTNVSSVRNFS